MLIDDGKTVAEKKSGGNLSEEGVTVIVPSSKFYLERKVGGRAYRLYLDNSKSESRVGRNAECEIFFWDDSVTGHPGEDGRRRDHATFKFNTVEYLIADLGSTNGTFINDEKDRLEPEEYRPLRDGDRIRFGKVEVVFREDRE